MTGGGDRVLRAGRAGSANASHAGAARSAAPLILVLPGQPNQFSSLSISDSGQRKPFSPSDAKSLIALSHNPQDGSRNPLPFRISGDFGPYLR